MLLLTVTTMMPTRSGFVWFPFEVEAEDFDDAHDMLVEEGCLRGNKLETETVDGARLITKRIPYILGLGMVGTICPCHLDLGELGAR